MSTEDLVKMAQFILNNQFLKDLNNCILNMYFTHARCRSCIPFFDLKVKVSDGKLETDLHIKFVDHHH